MAKSDARFEYKANLSREDHDLSQPYGFTCAPGMLLPIWFDFATPGDSYYMSHDLPLLRSIQLLSPAMVDVKVHYETFFVPMQMIYQPFENTIFSLKNIQSSLYSPTGFVNDFLNNNFPLLNFQGSLDSLTDPTRVAECFRLLDILGLNPSGFVSGGLNQYTPNFFPYQLLAYHTIFLYYYRLDDKTEFNNYVANWDRFFNSSDPIVVGSIFHLRQRPWDFDYFTSIYRSPIVSDVNMQSILPGGNYSDLSRLDTVKLDLPNNFKSDNSNVTSFGSSQLVEGASVHSPSSTSLIRQMFANEKLAMITGRTRKNYDSQVLAHYGITVPHDVKHDLTMIHHDEFDLSVQEVTSLASTDDAPLGELAGKSYSAGHGEQFKFVAPCHGVVMTIFSVEPKRRYITGFDRINSITNSFDFPTPEFDRLGNVPMYRYESGYRNEVGSRLPSDIIGWKERFYQFKRKMPKVSMAFFGSNGVNNYASYFLNSLPFGEAGHITGSSGVSTSQDSRPDLGARFYINRGALDAMCLVPYYDGWLNIQDGENWNLKPWLAYARDPFIVNSHIKCKKVSWMSKDGEPVYPW